jgi:hypothetical protein
MLIGLGLFAVGSALAALAPDVAVLMCGRALSGVGGGAGAARDPRGHAGAAGAQGPPARGGAVVGADRDRRCGQQPRRPGAGHPALDHVRPALRGGHPDPAVRAHLVSGTRDAFTSGTSLGVGVGAVLLLITTAVVAHQYPRDQKA